MLSENAANLLALVRGIPALADTTSFTIGGKAADPALKEIPLPACRLLLLQDTVDEEPYTTGSGRGGAIVPGSQSILAMYSAFVIVPYADDDDMLNVEFPLIESVMDAIHGKESPSGHRWRYFGQRLAFVYPDRLGYEQRYTLDWQL